jgi:hypothetical protein
VIVDGMKAGNVPGLTIPSFGVVNGMRLRHFQRNGIVINGEGVRLNLIGAESNGGGGLVVNLGAGDDRFIS